jgi:hypothetical protein
MKITYNNKSYKSLLELVASVREADEECQSMVIKALAEANKNHEENKDIPAILECAIARGFLKIFDALKESSAINHIHFNNGINDLLKYNTWESQDKQAMLDAVLATGKVRELEDALANAAYNCDPISFKKLLAYSKIQKIDISNLKPHLLTCAIQARRGGGDTSSSPDDHSKSLPIIEALFKPLVHTRHRK